MRNETRNSSAAGVRFADFFVDSFETYIIEPMASLATFGDVVIEYDRLRCFAPYRGRWDISLAHAK